MLFTPAYTLSNNNNGELNPMLQSTQAPPPAVHTSPISVFPSPGPGVTIFHNPTGSNLTAGAGPSVSGTLHTGGNPSLSVGGSVGPGYQSAHAGATFRF